MPWCDTCDRFYNPNTLRADGTCPTCGRRVAPAPVDKAPVDKASTDQPPVDQPGPHGAERDRAPWHFKLLVAATAAYLGWRLVQGIVWVAEHL